MPQSDLTVLNLNSSFVKTAPIAMKHYLKPIAYSIRLACPVLVAAVASPLAWSQSHDDLEEVIITAHPLHEQGLSQSVEVLKGAELFDVLDSNLGDTLATQPGIRSASFGAAVGRPIIHGLGGPRVKTTEDRIDSLDVSITSTDHAVTVEPFIANQISVLKGASTLVYGSGAIGGVVDTETGRIPTQLNEEAVSGKAFIKLGDNGDSEIGAFRLDANLGQSMALHLDAFTKQADDYEIPGLAESSFQIAREEAEEAEEEGHSEEEGHDEEEAEGIVEGSRFDISGLAAGVSWVGERGHFGVSLSTTDAEYGLVGGHGHEEEEEEGHDEEEGEEHGHEEEEEAPGILDLEQTRFDLSGELLDPFSGVSSLSVRLGINDYEHTEIEGNGEVGTLFDNDAWEAQIQLKHKPIAGFEGVFGLQLGDREFSAIGEEAFVPPAETQTTGLYWVGESNFDAFSIELGGRIENSETAPMADMSLPERDFDTTSASVGIIVPTSQAITWSALLDYAERAPSIEELYSNGPHLATQTFEIGDVNLDEEASTNLSLSFAYETDVFDFHATLYRNDFSDFIFQSSTGEEEDELPVFIYQQADADFTGLDLELGAHISKLGGGDLDVRVTYDTVRAELSNSENLPRIPADRYGIELIWASDDWRAKLGVVQVDDQNDIASFELPTDGYSDISLRLERSFDIGDSRLTAFVHGHNLGDDEQRSHTSFVKDFVPAPGRRLEAGLRLKF